ncbi:MAG: hypothetical protein JJV98_00010, partial [Desulfosarcina sp.]|nr:hypothetical protein [Desulfobacterales bacterium]
WLKLVQIEATRGRLDPARKILAFVADIAGHTSRWQLSIALLAHELDMEDRFRRSINFLVDRRLNRADALNLLDTHYGDTEKCLAALDPANHTAYLECLMRWGRLSEARRVWQHISAHKSLEEEILLKYIDFLISNKVIAEARTIWRAHSGINGLTNSGFEHKPSGKGFDWRVHRSPNRSWHIQPVSGEGRSNSSAIKISFFGKENINFHHLYQIVPLPPDTPYRLTYWWRGMRLSTDQRPFIDIEGYDCRDFHVRGPMLSESSGWRQERIEFALPPGCNAVRVRLRRKPSKRFDNKIEGTLWLDDFKVAPLNR